MYNMWELDMYVFTVLSMGTDVQIDNVKIGLQLINKFCVIEIN